MSGVTSDRNRSERDPVDAVAFLARSPNRVAVLDSLRRDGPLDRRALRGRFDVARTTLHRNLDALAERGWVRETDAGYTVTPVGAGVARRFATLRDTVDAAAHLQPVLQWLPADALDLDLRALADADVVTADPSDPYAPVDRHVEALERADSVRALLPAVGLKAMAAARERVRVDGSEHDLVVEPGVADTLRDDPSYAASADELVASERVSVRVHDGSIPYYLGLLDDSVQLGVSDGTGMPRALLETDGATIREWAADVHDEYRANADPLF